MKAQLLPSYLWDAAARPFDWAEQYDCANGFVGGWVRRVTGKDVTAPYRGRYRTELGCLRFVRRQGGLVALMDAALSRVGIERVAAAEIGDVGAVEVLTPRGNGLVAGIRTDGGWAMLQRAGVLVIEAPAVAAWRL